MASKILTENADRPGYNRVLKALNVSVSLKGRFEQEKKKETDRQIGCFFKA